MNTQRAMSTGLTPLLIAFLLAACSTSIFATEPCGDFGECKTLVEINSSDGDIGFHFLMDGDDLVRARIRDPDGKLVFKYQTRGNLKEQRLTETFAESAEPLCFDPATDDDEENDDEPFVTLAQFLDRWTEGTYRFIGRSQGGGISRGETELTFDLPAAPTALSFDGSIISWAEGDDLGECATAAELEELVDDGQLPAHPEDVEVVAWEVVLEPDLDDGDPLGSLVYTVRVNGDIDPMAISVPAEYLASFPDDTPAKYEVGAIGSGDNATFSEQGDVCLNEVDGCEDEEEDDDEDEDYDEDDEEDEDE